jgi:hypothetical protein
LQRLIHEKHQFRVFLCGHKAIEAGAVCLLLMVQGHLGMITATHLEIASKTGLLAMLPVLLISFSAYARHFVNRWTMAVLLGISTFLADAVAHQSHYPGEYTEAALTGLGAFAFSVAVSYTPLGKRIDRLAESFLNGRGKAPTEATPHAAGNSGGS